MKDSIKKKPIQIICILLFALIVFSSLEKQDANTFREVQPESFIRSPIDQVIVSSEQLYVCYDDSELVNVYDMNGVFLWCIDAPSMRNCHFEILDGMLVVYNYRAPLKTTLLRFARIFYSNNSFRKVRNTQSIPDFPKLLLK